MSIEAFKKSRRRLLEEIFKNPDTAIIKASGRFENFLLSKQSYEITDDRWVQKSVPYTRQIDTGTKSNEVNFFALVPSIYEWLKYRKYGLNWRTEQERRSMAFAISTNIAKSGSFKYRNRRQRSAIIVTALEKTVPFMLKEIAKDRTVFVDSQLEKEISAINRE